MMFDAFWRAAAYCLMPRVVWLSFLPLLVLMASSGILAWLFWESGVAWVRGTLDASESLNWALGWMDSIGLPELRTVLAPLLLVAVMVPVLVVACLLVVTQWMLPTLVELVMRRRFQGASDRPELKPAEPPSLWWSVLRSVGLSVLALLVLALSTPLWLVPPLVLIVPPLVWGWLAMQLMSFDVLAGWASPAERQILLRTHRAPLWVMGVVTGLMGAAPLWIWALGTVAFILAPFLMVASIWMYTAVFAFTALWFAHYLLAALQQLRVQADAAQGWLPMEEQR